MNVLVAEHVPNRIAKIAERTNTTRAEAARKVLEAGLKVVEMEMRG